MEKRKSKRLHFPARDGVLDCATRLLVVTAVAEAAFANERAELDEGVFEHVGEWPGHGKGCGSGLARGSPTG